MCMRLSNVCSFAFTKEIVCARLNYYFFLSESLVTFSKLAGERLPNELNYETRLHPEQLVSSNCRTKRVSHHWYKQHLLFFLFFNSSPPPWNTTPDRSRSIA